MLTDDSMDMANDRWEHDQLIIEVDGRKGCIVDMVADRLVKVNNTARQMAAETFN